MTIPRRLAACAALALLAGPAAAQRLDGITSPQEHFGYRMGADRELTRWDAMVEYYALLDRQSDRIRVVDLGLTTHGNPYLLVIATSPENHADLESLRAANRRLMDPRGLSEAEVDALVAQGKVVLSQSFGLHSTEVAGAETAVELLYDLASRDDDETRRILDEVVSLVFPCFNPDGQIMVHDWYEKTRGTEYEGVGLPWLYHPYVGHDNNRDADYMNTVEARHTGRVLYREWSPQAYVDHHQMGSYGARMYVPPYSEPIRPHADPLVWRELSWYGAHVAYKLEENGKRGILNNGQYPGWGHFGWHWITPFHNMAGMLTESASASLATPLYVHPEQLRGGARQFPRYEPQSTIPSLWPGGWWRLRDIVEQQRIAAWAIADVAARNRETVLRNGYLKARRQVERGASGDVKAYVVPARQHDPLMAVELVNTLLLSDLEIQVAEEPLRVGRRVYEAGSYVVPMAQPKMGLVRNLLGRTRYPDNSFTRDDDGAPLRPYDTATHTMAEFMGVAVEPSATAVTGALRVLDGPVEPVGSVAAGPVLRLDGRSNRSFRAVNRLLDAGVRVRRIDAGEHRGDFSVDAGAPEPLQRLAAETGVSFESLDGGAGESHEVERQRVGLYQRYRGGSMDEGWTRLVLEQYGFPYTTLHDADVEGGDLRERFDVVIVPHDSKDVLLGQPETRPGRPSPTVYPPEYMSGLEGEGQAALRAFVEAGGTLLAFGDASAFAIETFELDVRDALEDRSATEFFCPGSTLRVDVDVEHPLALGMPEEALALFWSNPAFSIVPSRDNHEVDVVLTYPERDLLRSGWLVGEEHLARKAAMVSAVYGQGAVVLYGFRPQHRAQTAGTYKLVFNALIR